MNRREGTKKLEKVIKRKKKEGWKWGNKAKYSALDAPSSHLREGVTDRRTDGRTDIPSCRDATAHLTMWLFFSRMARSGNDKKKAKETKQKNKKGNKNEDRRKDENEGVNQTKKDRNG